MKLLLDLNLSPRVAENLRADGHEVARVGEVLDARSPDEAVLAEALRTGAIIVSRDQDFSALLTVGGAIDDRRIRVRRLPAK